MVCSILIAALVASTAQAQYFAPSIETVGGGLTLKIDQMSSVSISTFDKMARKYSDPQKVATANDVSEEM